jgi:hypothetical protein
MTQCDTACGYSVLELVFVAALITTVSGAAVPQISTSLDEFRAAGAARYVSSRLYRARMEAVMRSTSVAIQFSRAGSGYAYAAYRDGNGNGVLTGDIKAGVDRRVSALESLPDHFTGVDFGAIPGLPPIDPGATAPADDPIRLGAGSILAFSSRGTASSGTLYVRGRHSQYAVRVYGDTGKSRILKFHPRAHRWSPV